MCHLDPYDAIKLHKSRVLSLGTQEILINRQCGIMLRDLFSKFNRSDLDIKKVPDVTFIGEEGIDAEGLTKEFFTLVMNALTSGTGGYIMFEGGSDHLMPVISEEYYQSVYFSDNTASIQPSRLQHVPSNFTILHSKITSDTRGKINVYWDSFMKII